MTALTLASVGIYLNGTALIRNLSLRVEAAQVVTVMGESGVGKSTLLAYLCGTMDSAFQGVGRIQIGAEDISHLAPEERHLGILFQDDLLFPHLSVAENLAFGLHPALRGRQRRRRIEEALAESGLGKSFADRDPATLSGGQRIRVALMRTLLAEPRALLLDEPFSKLDIATRERFRQFVFDHARQAGIPTLLVTHDPLDAAAAAGPVVQLAIPD